MFVLEYLKDQNATQAAIRAGYSEKTAHAIGLENLEKPLIDAAIRREIDARAARTLVTADRVIHELAVIGFSDVRHYAINDDGNVVLAEDAPEDAYRAVSSIKRKVRFIPRRDAEPEKEVETEIKLWDKPGALTLIGKNQKLYSDQIEHSGDLAIRIIRDDD